MNNEGERSQNILRIAEDRAALKRKLDEYMSRLDKYRAPETQFDTLYKIAITQKLVDHGEVSIDDLRTELLERHGQIDEFLFNNAVIVIQDYMATGGKNIKGGTGLSFDKRIDEDDGTIM